MIFEDDNLILKQLYKASEVERGLGLSLDSKIVKCMIDTTI
jgi:hypothetical protein